MEDWVDGQMDRRPLASIFIFLGGFLTRDSVREPGYPWFTTNLGPTPGTLARYCDLAVWFSGPVGGITLANPCHEMSSIISPNQAGPEDISFPVEAQPLAGKFFYRRTFKTLRDISKKFLEVSSRL